MCTVLASLYSRSTHEKLKCCNLLCMKPNINYLHLFAEFRLLIHLKYTTAPAIITARPPRADNEPMTALLGDEEPLLDGESEHGNYR